MTKEKIINAINKGVLVFVIGVIMLFWLEDPYPIIKTICCLNILFFLLQLLCKKLEMFLSIILVIFLFAFPVITYDTCGGSCAMLGWGSFFIYIILYNFLVVVFRFKGDKDKHLGKRCFYGVLCFLWLVLLGLYIYNEITGECYCAGKSASIEADYLKTDERNMKQ